MRVALLSRFQSPRETKAILKDVAAGTVDVVIGTHRLLQKDVTFRHLGLVIIDEEQWFGVKHKERLKQLRTQVDVLTLTATPIPRTLQMAMSSVRDLSIIDTLQLDGWPSKQRWFGSARKLYGMPSCASLDEAGRSTLSTTGWKRWSRSAPGCIS